MRRSAVRATQTECPGRPCPEHPPGPREPGAADPRIRWYAPPHDSATLAPRTGCAGADPRPVRRDRDGRRGAVRPDAGCSGGGAGYGRRCRAARRSRGGGACFCSWRSFDRRASGTRVAAVHDGDVRSAGPGNRAPAGCATPRPDAAGRGRAEGHRDSPAVPPSSRLSTPAAREAASSALTARVDEGPAPAQGMPAKA